MLSRFLPLTHQHKRYVEKVLEYEPIAYFPMIEERGTTAYCLVNSAQNGTCARDVSTMTVGAGIGDGNTAPLFNGAADYVNIYSATLAGVFNGALGTIAGWSKVSGAGVWADGTSRRHQIFGADANNFVKTGKTAGNSMFWEYKAGGTSKAVVAALTPTAWYHWAISWNKAADAAKAYYAGAQQGATLTGLGVWAGALGATTTCIGADSTAPATPWSGYLAHLALWDRVLTPAEIAALATV